MLGSSTPPSPCSPRALDVLLHALGLDTRHRAPYRNRYVAGPGHHAEAHVAELVQAGLFELVASQDEGDVTIGGAVFVGVPWLGRGDRVYRATDEGRAAALVEAGRRWPARDIDLTDPFLTDEVPRV